MLAEAARQKAWPMTLRIQPRYDHSYYFIASFIEDHLRFHAQHLLKLNVNAPRSCFAGHLQAYRMRFSAVNQKR
ncbi:hypothetical protein MF573_19095 [Klebsiella pneumoniae]|nr:hypothetical protein MF573_19095 [Klebsiella pneumoniae]